MKTTYSEISDGQQNQVYRETIDAGGHMLRIDIKSDSYEFQSHARIELFNKTEGKWNSLATVHYGSMKTPTKLSYANKAKSATPYAVDRTTLIAQAAAILGFSTSSKTIK